LGDKEFLRRWQEFVIEVLFSAIECDLVITKLLPQDSQLLLQYKKGKLKISPVLHLGDLCCGCIIEHVTIILRAKPVSLLLRILLLSSLLILVNAGASAQSPEPFDTFRADIPWKDQMFHLDDFSIYLKRFPETIGYVLYYKGDKDTKEELRRRVERAKRYLVGNHLFWRTR